MKKSSFVNTDDRVKIIRMALDAYNKGMNDKKYQSKIQKEINALKKNKDAICHFKNNMKIVDDVEEWKAQKKKS